MAFPETHAMKAVRTMRASIEFMEDFCTTNSAHDETNEVKVLTSITEEGEEYAKYLYFCNIYNGV